MRGFSVQPYTDRRTVPELALKEPEKVMDLQKY
jgi:hypothetical protein